MYSKYTNVYIGMYGYCGNITKLNEQTCDKMLTLLVKCNYYVSIVTQTQMHTQYYTLPRGRG